MRKLTVVAVVLGCVSISAAVGAANLFPDQTWAALSELRDVYGGLLAPTPLPPPTPHNNPILPYTDDDGYAVMSAWKHYWARHHVVVVRREIAQDPHFENRSPGISCLNLDLRVAPYSEAMSDFSFKWSRNWLLEERFTHAKEFIVLSESLLPRNKELLDTPPANRSGYFAFSAVGFSHDRTRAVIYVLQEYGLYGGGWGELFLMRKNRAGAWVIEGNGNCRWIT